MAATYKRLLADSLVGRKGREDVIDAARRQWSQGFVAEEIDRFCRTQQVMDSSGRPHGGLLTGDDMVGWQATYEQPVTLDYFGLQVCKTGAWGQGPVFLQQLALLKGFDLGALDPMGDAFIHIVTEAAKLAFADREAYYGDPDFVDVPLDVLLSSDYAEHRRALIDAEVEQPMHLLGIVDGPDVHSDTVPLRRTNEESVDDGKATVAGRHLGAQPRPPLDGQPQGTQAQTPDVGRPERRAEARTEPFPQRREPAVAKGADTDPVECV